MVGIPGTGVGEPNVAAAAYTVTSNSEDIVVTITRLEDVQGLERALASQGVEAEVTYGGREDHLAGVETYPLDGVAPEPPSAAPQGRRRLRQGPRSFGWTWRPKG